MIQVYVIPSYKCNLNCPHCNIHLKEDTLNKEQFLQTLMDFDADHKVLFGGEPTLDKPLLREILATGEINSISTNLVKLDKELIKLFKIYNLDIATSWNPHRFTPNQYKAWLDNLRWLSNKDLSCLVLITLTEDLLAYNYEDFKKMLDVWNKIPAIFGVKFEYLVDPQAKPDLNFRADKWLCKLYKDWRWSFTFYNVKDIKEGYICDCSEVYTLPPSGIIQKGCPNFYNFNIIEECLSCPLAGICKPCPLQRNCAFPKELYKLISGDKCYGCSC